ncbi:MAG TPA: hypothetical protein PKY35_03485 [Candidatus Hydrogenedentes bacterium]|nr:hypothetical protein [Candidatus Hydrogenedentota bacterium]HOL76067.1 hypothetical protein [Candidatus Hydrogenedentota bacterium]HPO84681.1 hypothetical protein [Candidatus Hydrogenedentota bacterium]
MDQRFTLSTYLIRRKVFKLFGGAFHVFDDSGQLILYAQMKAFKLKEDIRLFTGEDMQTEVLKIAARQIIDFAASYDVIDSETGEKVGALRRKGFKSILRDEWIICGPDDNPFGVIREDTLALALIRRFLTNLVPQSFTVFVDDNPVCYLRQNFNPFVLKLKVDFSPDTEGLLDRRLGLAAATLLCAIEGRQG